MPLSLTVYFDTDRSVYRARFRGKNLDGKPIDVKRTVPRQAFLDAGLLPGRQSRQHDALAWQWASSEIHEVELDTRSALSAAQSLTLEEVWKLYRRRNPGDVAAITLEKNEDAANALIAAFNDVPLERINNAMALDFVRKQQEEGFRNRTISNRVFFLRRLLSYAYQWRDETGMAEINLHELPKIRKQEPKGRALTEEEFFEVGRAAAGAALPWTIDAERLQRILVAGVTTMLRRRPLLGFRPNEWLDPGEKWMRVPPAYMKGRGGENRGLSVPVAGAAIAALGSGRWSFVSPQTKGPTKRIDGGIAKVAAEAKIEYFTLHDLRRTGYTWLAEAGVEKVVRQYLMGHSTETTVSDQYDRSFVKRATEAVQVFDEIFARHGNIFGNFRTAPN